MTCNVESCFQREEMARYVCLKHNINRLIWPIQTSYVTKRSLNQYIKWMSTLTGSISWCTWKKHRLVSTLLWNPYSFVFSSFLLQWYDHQIMESAGLIVNVYAWSWLDHSCKSYRRSEHTKSQFILYLQRTPRLCSSNGVFQRTWTIIFSIWWRQIDHFWFEPIEGGARVCTA